MANVFVRRTSRAIKSRNAKDRAFSGNAMISSAGKILRGQIWLTISRLNRRSFQRILGFSATPFALANDKK